MRILIATTAFLALAGVAGYLLSIERLEPQTEARAANAQPSGEVDMSAQPVELQGHNVYAAICQVGHPVLVSRSELNDIRLVHFKGPFVQSISPRVYRYAYMAVDDIATGHSTNTLFYDTIDEYLPKAQPAELQALKIPLIDAIPAREDALRRLLGPWDYEHARQGDKKRVVYAQKACVLGKLSDGAYFDIQDGQVVKAKAVTNRARLAQVAHDQRSYVDDAPEYAVQQDYIAYGERAVARNGALDVVLNFVISREFGQSNDAYDLLSRPHAWKDEVRRMALQTEEGVEMDAATLKYRISDYQGEQMEVEVDYNLANGRNVHHLFGLERTGDKWRIVR